MMSVDEIVLREYREADLETIIRLDEVCFEREFRFDRESMRIFAEARGAISLIAESSSGEITGFVIVHVERGVARRRGYVVTLDVAPEFRRRGVARRLMGAAEERAAAAGAERMELHVFSGNEGATRFYEWLGYGRVRVVRGFYSGNRGTGLLDAFLYRRDLTVL